MPRMAEPRDDDFFPRGAVAFFVTMMVVYAATWLLIFAVMVSRGH